MATDVTFEILYREYYVRVFGLCRRMLGDPSKAEDAAQETFMKAFNQFDRYDPAQPFWRWVATIANNHCIDVLRRQNRSTSLFAADTDDASLPDTAPLTLDAMIDDESAESLADAIASLPDRYRVPLVLAYYGDASYDDIATQLDITRNHVGVLILRAKERLRDRLTMTGELS